MFNIKNLVSIQIGLASPEAIRKISYGEVISPETINYRSQKPEMGGLFCEKIFGPFKDYECHCGKYKKIRYQGIICEKCEVEVTSKQVRRERFGHIELATPCSHIWYLKGSINYIQILLSYYNEISNKELEEIIYFVSHICLDSGNSKKIKVGQYLDENISRRIFSDIINEFKDKLPSGSLDAKKAEMYLNNINDKDSVLNYFSISNFISKHTGAKFGEGAEAIKYLLSKINLKEEIIKINNDLKNANDFFRAKLVRKLDIFQSFLKNNNKPEWMILNVIPVLPPDLRPVLPIDGGRFAISDLNDLYRRVIICNNRLKKLIEMNAPYIILMNEKRILQEAVDALIDNGRKDNKPVLSSVGHPLKCLTAILKGKQGRLRQNLLGKRVDYSGRSVIAVGPNLRMYQCGIPREIAVQLLKPFIISVLLKDRNISTYKEADELIDQNNPIIYDIVEEIICDQIVLLNRAPTLHRLGIQAFQPKLIDGRAIRLHPLVCTGFNADFDGDQMAVHLPLSKKAQEEAFNLMLASKNILDPKNGKSIVTPSQDMVLGNYYLTIEKTKDDFLLKAKKAHEEKDYEMEERYKLFALSDGKIFLDVDDVLIAYETKQISLHNRIAILIKALKKDYSVFDEETQNMYLLTSVGRIIFNSIFPSNFPYLNDADDKILIRQNLDKKEYLVNDFVKKSSDVYNAITNKKVRSPFKKNDLSRIINYVFYLCGANETSIILDKLKDQGFKYSTISGVTIALSDIHVVDNKKEIINKGDKQVLTVNKLYDDGLLTDKERHTKIVSIWNEIKNELVLELDKQLKKDIDNPLYIMLDSGARGSLGNFIQFEGMRGLVNKPNGDIIELPIKSNFREGMTVSEFFISTHGSRKGGADTALKTANSGYLTRRLVDVSQDIVVREKDCGVDHGFVMRAIRNQGEEKDIVSLYDRIKGRYAARDVKDLDGNIIVHANHLINDVDAYNIEKCGIKEVEIRSILTCQSKDGVCVCCYGISLATNKDIEIGEAVGIMAAQSIGEPGTQLTMRTFHSGGFAESDITHGLPRIQELVEARKPKGEAIISDIKGKVTKIDEINNGCFHIEIKNDVETREYNTIFGMQLAIKLGDEIVNGQKITHGQISPSRLLDVSDVMTVENYMLEEIHKPYRAQGIEINDKHIEIIVKQMLSKVLIVDNGDTELLFGSHIDFNKYVEENKKAIENGKKPAIGRRLIMGITKISLESPSFLSAASFQETPKILSDAAIKNKIDYFHGLKENVIAGKLIPAGRGLNSEKEEEKIIFNFSVRKKFSEIDASYNK